ncbi:MAG: MBL fold metallo-hydrolase [Bacteroidales bacterium]|nr:MBL fold metallo-hydrolase [Bacteroidales bacterium]
MKYLQLNLIAIIALIVSCNQEPEYYKTLEPKPELEKSEDTAFKEPVVFRNDDIVFHQIDEHTWHGNGHLVYNESVYLVEGEDKALLIDAGTKIQALRKICQKITDKPIVLVATHVHADHTGEAINEFDEIWINAADEVNVPSNMSNYKGKINYLVDGSCFDLGGRKIQVVFTPGHTPGSTTFIDIDAHYGFSGDAFGSGNLLIFTNLSTVKYTSLRMQNLIQKYKITHFYPGHYWGNNLETPQRVSDLAKISDAILNETIIPESNFTSQLNLIVDTLGVKLNYSNNGIF